MCRHRKNFGLVSHDLDLGFLKRLHQLKRTTELHTDEIFCVAY